jgi:hypothetical protein
MINKKGVIKLEVRKLYSDFTDREKQLLIEKLKSNTYEITKHTVIRQKEKKITNTAEDVILDNVYNEWDQAIETSSNGNLIKNTYNGDGLRVEKDVNGRKTNYLYEENNVILETDGDNKEVARNIYGTNLVARSMGKKDYTYMYNGHGDVTGLTDTEGMLMPAITTMPLAYRRKQPAT